MVVINRFVTGLGIGALAVAAGLSAAAVAQTLDFLGPVGDDEHPGYRDYVEMGCWQCHGFQGQGGDGDDGPALAPDVLPYEAFVNQVRRPYGVMPAYSPAILGDDRLRRIHDYLESLPAPPAPEAIPILSGD